MLPEIVWTRGAEADLSALYEELENISRALETDFYFLLIPHFSYFAISLKWHRYLTRPSAGSFLILEGMGYFIH